MIDKFFNWLFGIGKMQKPRVSKVPGLEWWQCFNVVYGTPILGSGETPEEAITDFMEKARKVGWK